MISLLKRVSAFQVLTQSGFIKAALNQSKANTEKCFGILGNLANQI